MKLKQALGVYGLWWLGMTVQAACPTWDTWTRFTKQTITYGSDVADNAIKDNRTGLIWRRCSEGQTWNGTSCTGSASRYTHPNALAVAKNAIGWRLPNVTELSSLADKGCSNPAIDATAFPNTLSEWYWSSSPVISYSGYVWFVYFYVGSVGSSFSRSSDYRVRLVRVGQ